MPTASRPVVLPHVCGTQGRCSASSRWHITADGTRVFVLDAFQLCQHFRVRERESSPRERSGGRRRPTGPQNSRVCDSTACRTARLSGDATSFHDSGASLTPWASSQSYRNRNRSHFSLPEPALRQAGSSQPPTTPRSSPSFSGIWDSACVCFLELPEQSTAHWVT